MAGNDAVNSACVKCRNVNNIQKTNNYISIRDILAYCDN